MLENFDVKDIFTVAARLRRLSKKEFVGSAAFETDFATLLDLIENWKKQHEKK